MVAAYAFTATYLLALLVHNTVGLRVTEAEEYVGLDIAQHGEVPRGVIAVNPVELEAVIRPEKLAQVKKSLEGERLPRRQYTRSGGRGGNAA